MVTVVWPPKIHGIECDACDWSDGTASYSDYKNWLNKPCPDCQANLLTQEQVDTTEKLIAASLKYKEEHEVFVGYDCEELMNVESLTKSIKAFAKIIKMTSKALYPKQRLEVAVSSMELVNNHQTVKYKIGLMLQYKNNIKRIKTDSKAMLNLFEEKTNA